MGIRGDRVAVPLLFLTFPTAIGVEPDGIARRAPGRTSRTPAVEPLSVGGVSSLSVGVGATFPFLALTSQYITIPSHLCQVVHPPFLHFSLTKS